VIGRHWLPPILWGVAILAADSVPHPGNFAPSLFPGSDKVAHFGMYGILAALIARAFMVTRTRLVASLCAIVSAATVGAIDELHQHIIPGRSMSAGDWAADATGATIAVVLIEAARRRRETLT
jgi:VanZ family protein